MLAFNGRLPVAHRTFEATSSQRQATWQREGDAVAVGHSRPSSAASFRAFQVGCCSCIVLAARRKQQRARRMPADLLRRALQATPALARSGPTRWLGRAGKASSRRSRVVALAAATAEPPSKTSKSKSKSKSKEGGVDYRKTVLVGKTDFSQRANAAKREPEIQKYWREMRIYERISERDDAKETFTLHDGPPYANGTLHMGHALNKILKDVINKFKVSQGMKVRYVPGWDCHGLPIELKVLQSLKQSERKELTPVTLRQKAAAFAEETVQIQRKGFERYGVYGEFDDPYLTLQPQYEAAQLEVFEEMVRGGHIYRAMKPVYWSPSTRTALAESELEYPEGHVSPSIYAAFKCTKLTEHFKEAAKGISDVEVAVWTTTPWTIPANRAVAVNPELEYAVVAVSRPDSDDVRRVVVASGLVDSLAETLDASCEVEARFPGTALEGVEYVHPLLGAESPVVLGGEYITTESGTGLVHTAPGHGNDDYVVGQKYGLEVAAPLDNAGNYTDEVGVESLVGCNVLKDANEKVCALLKEKGALLKEQPYTHKYPYDWRSKKPVITRATPQWFASIEGLRSKVLNVLEDVRFIPEGYVNRMRPMIVGRSDWCISRQRSWGVPIPVFYRKDNGEALLEPEVIAHVRGIVAEKGSSAWFELPEVDLLPEEYKSEADQYVKGTDTMDVWFDSGSSWAALREKLGTPVDLYLEGQDQHRGWFQSSLITSVAVQDRAPYKTVITHGFTIDQDGRKMSKSLGNVIDPQVIIEGGKNRKKEPPYGADVLRLWAATVDFTSDMVISQSIMAAVADNAIKLRNTARFMLANINDFDAAKHAVPYEELPLLDKYTIRQAEQLFDQMKDDFEEYVFPRAMRALILYAQDLSALYLDVAKDRLYIAAEDSLARRSCQTVLRWLVEQFAKVMSPVLCHLGEDIWQNLSHSAGAEESVLLAGWAEAFPKATAVDDATLDAFDEVLQLRDPSNQALQAARKADILSGTLEAQLEIKPSAESALWKSLPCLESTTCPEVDSLHLLLKVSAAQVVPPDQAASSEEAAAEEASFESKELQVTVSARRAEGDKCERCWIYSPTVGDSSAHPSLCSRCLHVVEGLEVSA